MQMDNVSEFMKVSVFNFTIGHLNLKYAINSKFFVKNNLQYIISGSEDGKVYFWNVQDQNIINRIEAFTGNFFYKI